MHTVCAHRSSPTGKNAVDKRGRMPHYSLDTIAECWQYG
jgi:hypothetical protein